MDSVVSAVNSSVNQASLQQAGSVAVLKKALDVQSSTAQQLIASLPQPQYSNPPNLGNKVDIKA